MHDLAPVIVSLVFFMVPIIAILTRHQQKMALIIHQSPQRNDGLDRDVEKLTREVSELKELIHQQTLMLDSLTQNRLPNIPEQSDAIKQRLHS